MAPSISEIYATKISFENASFELIKLNNLTGDSEKSQKQYIKLGNQYPYSQEIEKSAIDYYQKIIPFLRDKNFKVVVNISSVSYGYDDFDVYSFHLVSQNLNRLNNKFDGLFYRYPWFEGRYLKNKSKSESVIFQGFLIPQGEISTFEFEFLKLIQNHYPDIKLN